MPNIRIDLLAPIHHGQPLTFRSPADCSQVTGLIIYYPEAGTTASTLFQFADAHGNNVGNIDNLFAENVLVKVILDTTLNKAYVQNADTNAYLEDQLARKASAHKVSSGSVIDASDSVTAPLHGLKLYGKTTQVTTTGKNLLPCPYDIGTSSTKSGVTATVSEDGKITLNGTATADVWFYLTKTSNDHTTGLQLPVGKYFLTGIVNEEGKFNLAVVIYKNGAVQRSAHTHVQFEVLDVAERLEVRIQVYSGTTMNNVVFEPMISQSGDGIYERYTGGIPSPNPDYPQELVKAGASGSIVSTITDGTDSNVQTITAQTPNGLPGIPVASGGNYTDENGQQWICDEIDFARGVYVQRVRELDFATFNWKRTAYSNEVQKGYYAKVNGFYDSRYNFFHTHYKWLGYTCGSEAGANALGATQSTFNNRTIGEIGFCSKSSGQDNFAVVVGINDGTPVGILQLVCVEPVETPLTAEELAQYAALHTNKPETVVYNDAGAEMEVSYFTPTSAIPIKYGQSYERGKLLTIDEFGCVAKTRGLPSMVGIVASDVDITAGTSVDGSWEYYDVYK